MISHRRLILRSRYISCALCVFIVLCGRALVTAAKGPRIRSAHDIYNTRTALDSPMYRVKYSNVTLVQTKRRSLHTVRHEVALAERRKEGSADWPELYS